VQAVVLRNPAVLAPVGALAALNVTLGVLLATGRTKAVMLAFVPVVIVALGGLIASNRAVLVFAALGIDLFAPLPLTGALPLPTPVQIYPSDVLLLLAVGSWVAAWLIGPEQARPSSLRTRVLSWPLLLFGLALLAAVLHGHLRYGTSMLSLSLRLLVYAGIAAAMTDLKPRDAYKSLVVLFYAATVWQALVAAYDIATGTSSTRSANLSTGGERLLAGSTAMFMIGAILLALLNLERNRRASRNALHLLMAALATFALANTFARANFALVALLVPLFLIGFRRVRVRAAVFLPLAMPFVAAAALLVPQVDPSLFPTLRDRVTASTSTDTAVNYRRKASAAVWEQIREAPVTGSGFGRPANFTVNYEHFTIIQDPHNQFLYLWAGGGLLLLTSFLLLLLMYLWEAWRRLRTGTRDERLLIFWAVSVWFVFVVNSLSGAILTAPHLLLVFWVLMLLPMTVRPRERAAAQLA
jgi:O-antigen ligase/polysaccharide polymerase Wzy-like membrane protein